jgi:hypothetical protein
MSKLFGWLRCEDDEGHDLRFVGTKDGGGFLASGDEYLRRVRPEDVDEVLDALRNFAHDEDE